MSCQETFICQGGVTYPVRYTYTRAGAINQITALDGSGSPFDPRANGSWQWGQCVPADVVNRIYLNRNTAVLTLAQIQSAIGAGKIISITVKQLNGTGQITPDAGATTQLNASEVWEWGERNSMNGSALSMNAGSGEQRITAVYTI